MCQLTLFWETFHNVYMYQIITFYILNLHNVTCQSDLRKAQGKTQARLHPILLGKPCFTKSKRSCLEFLSDSQGASVLAQGRQCQATAPKGAEHSSERPGT